jgi:hypothetical protein
MIWTGSLAAAGLLGVLAFRSVFAPAPVPARLEYLPSGQATTASPPATPKAEVKPSTEKGGAITFDFSAETVGAAPQTFVPVVGNWLIGDESGNRVLVVDGRSWRSGQTAAGIADRARSLYGERYAEFLDNVQAFAYFPYAVAMGVEDFREGEISLRFKGIDGRIDQAMGILFDLKPNGDYLTVRANPLEDNLVLWSFIKGKRSSVKWIRNTPTPTRQWHDLKVVIKGTALESYLNGKLYLSHTLARPVSGRVGVWSKADSVVYVDDFSVHPKAP